MEFRAFDKIPRLKRECIITEKIDGTNAQIVIEDGATAEHYHPSVTRVLLNSFPTPNMVIYAGSRNRWIVPGDDNYGFARWVYDNAEELVKLGPGTHFGEWWGSGIQRGYGLRNGDKRFSLFNTSRWNEETKPACCSIVPVLYRGAFSTDAIDNVIDDLVIAGSQAAPGFMKPEGIIVFHAASRENFKVTIEKDEEPKGLAA